MVGVPSYDEIVFLRTGLKKATEELKERNTAFFKIRDYAREYEKEFKAQTLEFQSLKEQLIEAQEEIKRKDEDLKYKQMSIIRLKEFAHKGEDPTQVKALQGQLKAVQLENKELQSHLNQWKSSSQDSPVEVKLKQALEKIDQQGRVIQVLAQKLLDCGQSVDLAHLPSKK